MASSQARAFWDLMRGAPAQIGLPLDQRRAAGERAEDATAEPHGVAISSAPEEGGFWVVPEVARPRAAILYFYGGGYVLGSPLSRRKTAGHLALAARATVLVPSNRLAPEHPFPAAIEDAVKAYQFLLTQGFPADQVVLAGDSAGGGLAAGCGLALSERGIAQPAGVLAFSPWADLSCSGRSMEENASSDIECTRDGLLAMAAQYLGAHDARDPLASPVFGTFKGVRSLYCVVGSDEVLLDDSLRLIRAAAGGGADAQLHVRPGMQHVFPIWSGAFPEAGEEIAMAGAWVQRQTSTG